MLARTESQFLFFFDNFPLCIPVTTDFSAGSDACGWSVNPRQLHLARAVRAPFTEHVMPLSSLLRSDTYYNMVAAAWQQVSLLILTEHFEVNTAGNGKAAVAVLARFTGMFLSDLCLCAKAYVWYADEASRVSVVFVSSELGSAWRDMRVPVCGVSACFCRTVPHLSFNNFGAPLGYCRLVLGLNVSYFFRSLGTSNGARAAKKTRPSGSRRP